MKIVISILSILSIIGISQCASVDKTDKLDVGTFASENDFLAKLNELQVLKGQKQCCGNLVDGELLKGIMHRGWFDSAMQLIDACADNTGKKIDAGIHQAASTIRKRVSEITSFLHTSKQGAQEIAPAFEWAQSKDTVFISVKFAHKLDAPACIDLKEDKLEITEDGIIMAHTCTGKNKKFNLKLEFLHGIVPANSTWSMASVGRGTLTLSKATLNSKWERLLKNKNDKPRNMHVWWTLHEKYEAELEQAERDAKAEKLKQKTEQANEEVKPETKAEEKEEEPKDPLAVEKAKQIKLAQKTAKSEIKKLTKQSKKEIKAIDTQLKKDIKELETKFNADKTDVETKSKASRKEAEEKFSKLIAQVETRRDEAIDKIENFDASQQDETHEKGAFGVLYDMVSHALFGTKDNSTETPVEDEKKNDKEL